MKGIVFDEGGLSVATDLSVRDIRPDEVRVDIQAAGVCHSDVSVINGTIPFPTPVVLGHEGVGIVSEVGSGVTGVALGDHVVISTRTSSGRSPRSSRPVTASILPSSKTIPRMCPPCCWKSVAIASWDPARRRDGFQLSGWDPYPGQTMDWSSLYAWKP